VKIGSREFSPSLWPSAAAVSAFALFLALGSWQTDRAAEKQSLHETFMERGRMPAVDIGSIGDLRRDYEQLIWRRVRLSGSYETGVDYLLDNQVRQGRAGYLVYSPFRIGGSGERVLVSRGWIAAGADRGAAPAIEVADGEQLLEGLAKPVPVTPVLAHTPPEPLAPGTLRVQRIDPAAIAAAHGWTVLPYEVRLDGPSEVLVRDWAEPGSGRERHLGYAFQWYLLAAAVAVIYVIVNLKRAERPQ
jgi:surfeit locus 1 family protein